MRQVLFKKFIPLKWLDKSNGKEYTQKELNIEEAKDSSVSSISGELIHKPGTQIIN